MPVPNVQWITPDDGQRTCPKHGECRTRINLEISASVGFIVKIFLSCYMYTVLNQFVGNAEHKLQGTLVCTLYSNLAL